MFVRLILSLSLIVLFMSQTRANQTSYQVKQWRQSHEQQIVDQFAELLSIPNVATDKTNILRNASHISSLLKNAGMHVKLLELEGSNPVVFAERSAPGATQTVMIYIHYDGQPVNPDNWASDPWKPVMRTDMVENGVSGLLLPPGNEAALAAALLRLANDKTLREHLGDTARQRAEVLYNWPEACKKVLSLCTESANTDTTSRN